MNAKTCGGVHKCSTMYIYEKPVMFQKVRTKNGKVNAGYIRSPPEYLSQTKVEGD